MTAGAPDFRIVIPGAPKGMGRAKTRVVHPRVGKAFATIYTPTESRSYATLIRCMASDQMKASGRQRLFDCALEIRMVAYLPIPSSFSKKKRAEAIAGTLFPVVKPDWDNVGKFSDALKSVVFTDDCRFVNAFVFKRYAEIPRLIIEIRIMRQQDRDVVHVAA